MDMITWLTDTIQATLRESSALLIVGVIIIALVSLLRWLRYWWQFDQLPSWDTRPRTTAITLSVLLPINSLLWMLLVNWLGNWLLLPLTFIVTFALGVLVGRK